MSLDRLLDSFGVLDDFSKHIGEVKCYNIKKEVKMKVCSRCGKAKPLEEFWTDKRMIDGRKNVCKKCTNIDRDIRRETQREAEVMEMTKEYPSEEKQEKILKVEDCNLCGKESLCITIFTGNSVCINCLNDKVSELIGGIK